MKICFVGKGGSGKTTLAALFARHLAATTTGPDARPAPLLAIDADINQHLAAALGASDDEAVLLPALGDHMVDIKEYLRGDNPRISSAAVMVKTTPPGRGSRLLTVAGANPVYDALVREVAGIRLAVTGPFATDDLGVACYHSKVGAVELLLNHLVDGPGEYVVVDMTAGADSFASGLFTRFDATFLVCEPTVRSVGVYRQYVGYARDHGVRVHVVGNKIDDESDVDFLREHVGDDLLTWIGRSGFVKAAERGQHQPITAMEPANRDALDTMRTTVDACVQDWASYTRQAVEFHLRNAAAWANDRVGENLADQVDPEFVLGPDLLVR
ncbi:ATP-binding protein [Micromonospora sp. LOL_023]|uniref:ATP-binding protein n=1 Tax=Micromonospora sp. LOL_023 TaxID=3345418 RepID=UPI003A851546